VKCVALRQDARRPLRGVTGHFKIVTDIAAGGGALEYYGKRI